LTIYVWAVTKPSITPFDWTPPLLVDEMPVKAGVRTMPCALVLKELWTLLRSKLLQVSEMKTKKTRISDSSRLGNQNQKLWFYQKTAPDQKQSQ